MSPATARRLAHRRPAVIIAGVAVVVAAILAALIVYVVGAFNDANAAVRDMRGAAVSIDDDQRSTVADRTKMRAVASIGARIEIPSVGLDVPVGEISELGQRVVPPGFTSVYRDRDRGVSLRAARTGTVYLFTHSLRGGGRAPGNFLIDVAHQRSAIPEGAVITVGGWTYKVDSWTVVDKKKLPAEADVWAYKPGRLILITCLQKPDNTPSTRNIVISATLTSSMAQMPSS